MSRAGTRVKEPIGFNVMHMTITDVWVKRLLQPARVDIPLPLTSEC